MRYQWNMKGTAIPIAPIIDKLYTRIGNTQAAYFCPACGNEVICDWHFIMAFNPNNSKDSQVLGEVEKANRDKKELIDEAERFSELKKCPICGKELLHDKGYFLQNDGTVEDHFFTNPVRKNANQPGKWFLAIHGIDEVCQFLAKERVQIEKDHAKQAAELFVSNVEATETFNTPVDEFDINHSADTLQKFIHILSQTEARIISETSILGELYYARDIENRDIFGKAKALAFSNRMGAIDALKKIEDLKEQINQEEHRKIEIRVRQKPEKPEPPVLRTPTFFNRNKVETENKRLLEKYEIEKEQYQRNLESIHIQEQAALKKEKECHEKRIKILREKLEEAQVYYFQNYGKRDLYEKEITTTGLWETVVAVAEDSLRKLLLHRKALYSTNAIFPKYRNFVAVTTINEYIMSGRCSELEGASGAYNMYETECRSKVIENQLSQIIGNLEQIKTNQYFVWKELSTIHSDLENIQSCVASGMAYLAETNDRIASYADFIAQTSLLTVHYEKLNAEIAASDVYITGIIC